LTLGNVCRRGNRANEINVFIFSTIFELPKFSRLNKEAKYRTYRIDDDTVAVAPKLHAILTFSL